MDSPHGSPRRLMEISTGKQISPPARSDAGVSKAKGREWGPRLTTGRGDGALSSPTSRIRSPRDHQSRPKTIHQSGLVAGAPHDQNRESIDVAVTDRGGGFS